MAVKHRKAVKKHKKIKKKNKNFILYIAVAAVIAAAALCVFKKPVLNMWYEYKLNKPVTKDVVRIKKGVTIMGEDVSGMTREEAIEYISAKYPAPGGDRAVLIKSSDGTKVYDYKLRDMEINYDIPSAVDKAISFANEGMSEDWFRDFKILENGNVDFIPLNYNYFRVKSNINAIAKEVEVPVKNSEAKRVGGTFTITPSATGYDIDSQKLLNEVLTAFNNREFGKEIVFDINEAQPKYTEDDFAEINHLLGSYSSNYSGGDANRISNLKTACQKINETVVYPGEVFSNNAKFNPCTEENGWKNAGTIVNGKIEDSIGGGMCQISSALYMAALEAELEIVERHNHSLKVGYMPYAYDATLAGDYKDLKFKNNTDKPIYIEAFTTTSQVCVRIYGKEIHNPSRRVEFENKYVSTQEPGEPITKYDSELYEGTQQLDVTALSGKTYELYKKVYENNKLIDTVKINTSVYLPRRQVTLIGTKKYTQE